jgi:hypothetical protein
MKPHRRTRPSLLRLDGRGVRPGPWLAAAAFLSLLLVEVWQNSQQALLSLSLDRHRTELTRAQARLDFLRAEFERKTTRAELAPEAKKLGLLPADPQQIVSLPSEYLADGDPVAETTRPASLLAWAERASRALVPEARAKSRTQN